MRERRRLEVEYDLMIFHLTKRFKPFLSKICNTCVKSTLAEGGRGLVIKLDVAGRLG